MELTTEEALKERIEEIVAAAMALKQKAAENQEAAVEAVGEYERLVPTVDWEMASAVQPLCVLYAHSMATAARNSASLTSAGMPDAADMQRAGAGALMRYIVSALLECGRILERAEGPVARICDVPVDEEPEGWTPATSEDNGGDGDDR